MEFDVLVAGELNADLNFNQIKSFPAIGKEVLANQMELALGSSSAIFATNLSTMGARVAFIGMIGNDSFGDLVMASLESKKVDTRFILRSDDYNTGATVVMNQDNDRAMLTFPGAMAHLSTNHITDSILEQAGHLHVSSIFLQPALKQDIVGLMTRAKKLGLTTSLDPQWDPEKKWDIPWDSLLQHVDIFLPNMREFILLSGEKDLRNGFSKLYRASGNLVVKDGANGAHACNNGEMVHLPAFLNPAVADSIGAGDCFDAGFIHKFIRKESLHECLRYGNLMGALNTTAAGGTGAFTSFAGMQAKILDMWGEMI